MGYSLSQHKPLVLFFHGLTGDPSEVKYLKEFLESAGFEVVTPLLPGHGQSIAQLAQTTLAEWTSFALEKFDQLPANRLKVVGGVSLGSLLALYIAEHRPNALAGVIALSPPVAVRSAKNRLILGAASYLPEFILNRLWLRKKVQRPANYLKYPHNAFSYHSLGSLSRLLRLRREVLKNTQKIDCPVFAAQDPEDHHLASSACATLGKRIMTPTTLFTYPGGQHELTLGHRSEQVFSDLKNWLEVVLERSSEIMSRT